MTKLTEIQAIYKATSAFFAESVPKSLADMKTEHESGEEISCINFSDF
jgi:hypothetical protein